MKKITQKFAAVLILVLTTGFSQLSFAQEVQFSQFNASSLYLNPALAGVENDVTFNSNFRSQWSSISTSQVTSQLSAILPLVSGGTRKKLMGGVGVGIFNNSAGAGSVRETGFRATYAYSVGLNNEMSRFSIGLQGGLTQRSIDANAQWGSQYSTFGYNPATAPDVTGLNNKVGFPVFNAGLFYSYNPARNYYRAGTSIYSGISLGNINKPNASFFENGTYKVPQTLKLHGGFELHGNRKFNFGPQFLVAATKGHGQQVNVGMAANYRLVENPFGLLGNTDLIFSGWYRVSDGIIAAIGISNATYTLGFSYDITTSSLSSYNNGSGAYEISFSIRNAKDRRRRRFDSPRI